MPPISLLEGEDPGAIPLLIGRVRSDVADIDSSLSLKGIVLNSRPDR